VGCFSLQQTDTDPSSHLDLLHLRPNALTIVGAGPAGSAAAIAARSRDVPVELYEKSRIPRHKVCGEFLSPGIVPVLDRLGVWDTIQGAGAVPVRRILLRFGRTEKRASLPETACGLSRFTLDAILLNRAIECGARLHRCSADTARRPVIIASGRVATAPRSSRAGRLFGFKAHYTGPQDDGVELFFGSGAYIGVSSIENGRTNVCGLARESLLASYGFDYDELCEQIPGLKQRMSPLTRCMDWLSIGPVLYSNHLRSDNAEDVYLAGDSLAFVDPFTGTGITNAVFSGEIAGQFAAIGAGNQEYMLQCRRAMARGYAVSASFRRVLEWGWAAWLKAFANPGVLYRATRPLTRRVHK
jgi:hypothetical protein